MKVNYKTMSTIINIKRNSFKTFINSIDDNKKYLFLVDEYVMNKYKEQFLERTNIIYYVLKAIEENKSFDNVLKIIDTLILNSFTKTDFLVCVGGGIISDLGGFVSSIYKRGISYINVPTTLLAQIDSAIGGKTGCNYSYYKNQIGTIYHPTLVIVDPNFINTLNKDDLISGMCEVLKYAILFDEEMFEELRTNGINIDLTKTIKKCINIKAKITKLDEFDRKERRLLNFGHTIGHAIELKFNIPHGKAIGYGMYLETINNKEVNRKIKEALEKLGLDFTKEYISQVQDIIQDKKIKNGKITKVYIEKIGKAYLQEVNIDEYFQK